MSYTSDVAHVEFIGGPMDGHTRAVPIGSDGAPASHITLESVGVPGPADEVVPVVVTVYLRHLNEHSEGGLWEYVWCPPPGHDERMRAALG